MIEPKKTLMAFVVASAFVLASFSPPWAAEGDVNITWQEETTLSADLSGVSLESVLEHLSDKQDIWFRVHKSVADHKISVRFAGLSLEEGLRRIFAGLDYSLEFDGQGKPCGIVIVGEKQSARGKAKASTARRSVPGPRPDTTGPMGPDNPDEPDEEMPSPVGGPYGPSGATDKGEKDGEKTPPSPVESAADELSPYGPTGGVAREQGHQKTIRNHRSPVESGEVNSPYGPGDVKPGIPKRAKRSQAPQSPVESVHEAGEAPEEGPQDPDAASP
ncbi:MAG: hypothetical protein SWQ30_04025 [Thermodesulfobacteriota bacterium]|nr:hypothetical protein [Thermodesulfobacteriota bacterium]